jgi:hypothetical protein
MVRWLTERGLEASAFDTEYGESDDDEPAAEATTSTADAAPNVADDLADVADVGDVDDAA